MPTLTTRLSLDRPTLDDVAALHQLYSDPAVWTHLPGARHSSAAMTRTMVEAWMTLWEQDGLGPWVVREVGGGAVIGSGGCAVRADSYWNLSYRFAVETHGRGYATELSLEAIRQARLLRPALPIVAYLLEHNKASARVAEKSGLTVAYRGPDARHPDPRAMRLVYADRELDQGELAQIVH